MTANDTQHSEISMDAVAGESFAAGKGVLSIPPEMSDAALLSLVKKACVWSQGKPFVIVPPYAGSVGGCAVPALLSYLEAGSKR